MKLGRNNPCPCGSGIKSKKCCNGKTTEETEPISLTIPSILGVIKFGLEQFNVISEGSKSVRVKEITVENGGDAILCKFYAVHNNSLDIKNEMAVVISFLYGFFKEESYEVLKPNYFSAQAINDQDIELLYVVSSKTSAASITSNSFEWIRTSMFIENTADYRLSRAKTMISDIENGLRTVITDIYKAKYGAEWWKSAIENTIAAPIERTYNNQFGVSTTDGNVLINYGFILDIKKIISSDWGTFKHLFQNKVDFENAMVELNTIRREEAHNREISSMHLEDLERLYEQLLSEISISYPALVLTFLVENWRIHLKKIMHISIKPTYTLEEFNALNEIEDKRQLIIKDCNNQIAYVDGIIIKLRSLKPPVSKKIKHEALITQLEDYLNLQINKLDATTNYNFENVQKLLEDLDEQRKRMDIFSKEFLIEES